MFPRLISKLEQAGISRMLISEKKWYNIDVFIHARTKERERERERALRLLSIDFVHRKGSEYFYSLSLIDRTADITVDIFPFLFTVLYRSVTKPNFRHSNVTRAKRDLSAGDEEVTDTLQFHNWRNEYRRRASRYLELSQVD